MLQTTHKILKKISLIIEKAKKYFSHCLKKSFHQESHQSTLLFDHQQLLKRCIGSGTAAKMHLAYDKENNPRAEQHSNNTAIAMMPMLYPDLEKQIYGRIFAVPNERQQQKMMSPIAGSRSNGNSKMGRNVCADKFLENAKNNKKKCQP